MLVLDEAATRHALPFEGLVGALKAMFATGCEMPVRHHHEIAVPGEDSATLLLMPAWKPGAYYGVKMVSVFPGNSMRNLPAIHGAYLLSSGMTGELLAIVDGGELTARRTAAASALAAGYLARMDAATMLMVGTGRLSENLIEAHATMRDLKLILIWGRDIAKAEIIARNVAHLGIPTEIVGNLAEACGRADIISCATLSSQPLICGEWLKPGTHLDLVGAFKPSMRESDDAAARRSSIFVDTLDGACAEAGDIVQPLRSGLITLADIKAELATLCRGEHPGRSSATEITMFKSVGAALEDLAGAIFALEHQSQMAADEA